MRALAFFALTSIAAAAGIFLACSSDDTNAGTGSSSGSSGKSSSGNSSGTSGTGTSGGSSGTNVPEGGTLSPDGKCIIYCSPYQTAGKIASIPRTGVTAKQIPWTNPEGALQQDKDNLASVTLNEGEESEYLEVTNFDFKSIGDDKQTWGIQVALTRQSDDGGVGDALIEVLIDGQQDKVRQKILTSKENGGSNASWPRVQIGTHEYGQAVDTWGVDLNPVDVRKDTFGARIAAKRLVGITSAPVKATVDALRVSVCSCVPNSAQ